MMIFAAGAVGGSAWAGDTGQATRVAMPLGAAAPAPGGFLDFCRREPTQCERSAADARDPAAVSRLASQLFWQQAFARTNAAAPAATRPTPVSASGRGTYDWSRVFPNTQTAQRAPARPAEAQRPARLAAAQGAVSAEDFGSQAVDASADGMAYQAASAAEIARNPIARTFARLGVPMAGASATAVPAPRIAPAPRTQAMPDAAGAASADAFITPSPRAEQPAAVETAVLTLDAEAWALLNRVNRSVNRRIRQTSDQSNYGKPDFWELPSGRVARGDCEDYVLAKRQELIAAGVPAEVLSIAIVDTQWGESHAVLLVAGDTGEVVLDNLSAWISRWDRTGYTWRERQAPGSVFEWVNVAA